MAERHDTLHNAPGQSSFAVHNLRDVTDKEVLATDYYYQQASWEVNKNSSMLVFLLGLHEAASIMTHCVR